MRKTTSSKRKWKWLSVGAFTRARARLMSLCGWRLDAKNNCTRIDGRVGIYSEEFSAGKLWSSHAHIIIIVKTTKNLWIASIWHMYVRAASYIVRCTVILNMEIAFARAGVLYMHTNRCGVYGHLCSGYGERVVYTIELCGRCICYIDLHTHTAQPGKGIEQ